MQEGQEGKILTIREISPEQTFGDTGIKVEFKAESEGETGVLDFVAYSPRLFPFLRVGVQLGAEVVTKQRQTKRGIFTDRKVVELYSPVGDHGGPEVEQEAKDPRGGFGKALDVSSRETNTALMELGRFVTMGYSSASRLSTPQGELWWATIKRILGATGDSNGR